MILGDCLDHPLDFRGAQDGRHPFGAIRAQEDLKQNADPKRRLG